MEKQPPISFLRRAEVCARTGLSSSQIDRLERSNRFPKRRRISERASAYLAHEVEAWMLARPLADEVRADSGGDPRRRGVGKSKAATG